MLVAQHLEFNVARMFKEFFHVDVRRAKGLLRFAPLRLVRGQQLVLSAHNTHSTAAATGGPLPNQRIPDTSGFARKLRLPFNNPPAPATGTAPSRLSFPPC